MFVPLLLALGCQKPIPTPPGDDGVYERIEVAGSEARFDGLSGSAPGPDGTLWVVTEDAGWLLRLNPKGQPSLDRRHPIQIGGLPAAHDVEALAWLRGDHFVLGLEGAAKDRNSDPVLWMRRVGEELVIEEEHPIFWGLWNGLQVKRNHGVEGACFDGADVWIAGEPTGKVGDRRFAPLARWDADKGEWEPHQLWLTSETGKISGLSCTSGQAVAIERHYGVQHVLSFSLDSANIEPTVIAMPGQDGNYEGITATRSGEIVLVGDNNYRRRQSPTWVVRFQRQDR